MQSYIDLLYISQAYADRKKKLNLLMKAESKPFITAIQKSFLANENPLTIKASSKNMGPWGHRTRRFENLEALLSRDPLDGEGGYTHSWSSLASSSDGQTIVTLDYRGKPQWYEVKELDQEQQDDPVIPASKCTFVERINNFSHSDHGNLLPNRHPAYKGLELVESTTSRDTSYLLLKSRKSYQLQNVLMSEHNGLATQIIANITLDEGDILDGCMISNGIAGVYDYLSMIDRFGKIYIQNVDNLNASTSRSCIGNLEDLDSSLSQNQKSCWASIRGSCNGDHLFAATRKIVKLFDLRSRPHEGNYSKIFSIPTTREHESSSEMIGGILNNHKASEGLLYFCSNLRIGAVDKRMPGRVCSQVQLHNSPSFSKKVALPSGLTSFSTMCRSNYNPSRLDYLAAWMPYSSSSRSNHPSAIVTCFDQSYNFCVCRNSSFNRLRISSLEECQNGDHSDISTAPLVIRGKPLRIGGPQCCIDFSDEQLYNRLLLPCTGSVITRLHASKFNRSSDLSILTTNVAGDIFMTSLSENKEQDNRFTSSNKYLYDWKHIGGENLTLTDKAEQLREELINKWWIKESTFKNEFSKSSNVDIKMRFGHLKTANHIFQLKPNACLDSNPEPNSIIEETIDTMLETKGKGIKFSKEYYLLARSEGRLDSLGRVNYTKEIAHLRKTRKKKELKLIQQAHMKKINEKRWNSLGGTGRIFREACPRLKNILNPEKYSGPQGIRANDQLSSKEVDSSLRISREKYYTSHSENDKTPVTKYQYYKPPNYKDIGFWEDKETAQL